MKDSSHGRKKLEPLIQVFYTLMWIYHKQLKFFWRLLTVMFKKSSKVLSDIFSLQPHQSYNKIYHDFEKKWKWFFNENTISLGKSKVQLATHRKCKQKHENNLYKDYIAHILLEVLINMSVTTNNRAIQISLNKMSNIEKCTFTKNFYTFYTINVEGKSG